MSHFPPLSILSFSLFSFYLPHLLTIVISSTLRLRRLRLEIVAGRVAHYLTYCIWPPSPLSPHVPAFLADFRRLTACDRPFNKGCPDRGNPARDDDIHRGRGGGTSTNDPIVTVTGRPVESVRRGPDPTHRLGRGRSGRASLLMSLRRTEFEGKSNRQHPRCLPDLQ